MDDSEKLILDSLIHIGHTRIEYEPDGKVPPDFVIDGRIAIEVRRLNENYYGADTKGLEEISIPLWFGMRKLIESLGPPTRGESWFVFYRFKRPLDTWITLQPKLKAALLEFINSSHHEQALIDVGNSIELKITRAQRVYPTFFVPSGYRDKDSGGWLIDRIKVNLNHCIREKTIKVAPYRVRYPEWWLILPDHIAYSLDDFERELFRTQVSISHDWDKIILVDPRDHTRIFVI